MLKKKMSCSVELYNELRNNTLSNLDHRRAKQEEERRRQDERLTAVLDRLETVIMSSGYDKMRQASLEGHFYATLYSFTNQDVFEDFKTVFLVKGPYKNGLEYFESRGIVPLMARIHNVLKPIDVYLKYDRHTRTHHLMVSWKNMMEN